MSAVHLKVVVDRQEVVLEWEGPTEAFLEVFDAQFGEMSVEPLDQLLHHQPHVLESVALDTVTLWRTNAPNGRPVVT